MTPDDYRDALLWLVAVSTTYVVGWIVGRMILDVLDQVPVVTKHPITGELYIPRSDLYIGEGRCHGAPVTRPRPSAQR